jgi:hypothetical protein
MSTVLPENSRNNLTHNDRYYGLSETEANLWKSRVENTIIRMIALPDLRERLEVREAFKVIKTFGIDSTLDPEQADQILDLICHSQCHIPLLAKVWSVINLSEAAHKFPVNYQDIIWGTVKEAIETDPDDISFMILVGSWITGLAYGKQDQQVAEFSRISQLLTEYTPEIRWGIQVAASRLTQLLDADKLRMGLLTVKIQGGVEAEPQTTKSSTGYPDVIMILPQGSLPSAEKLSEAAAIGIPERSGILSLRMPYVMTGIEQELQTNSLNNLQTIPDRRWTFISPSPVLTEGSVDFIKGENQTDAVSLWIASRAIEGPGRQNKFHDVGRIKNWVTRVVNDMAQPVKYIKESTGETLEYPGIYQIIKGNAESVCGKQFYDAEFKEKLINSATGLIVSASSDQRTNKTVEIIVPTKDMIQQRFLELFWEKIPDEDRNDFIELLIDNNVTHILGLKTEIITDFKKFIINKNGFYDKNDPRIINLKDEVYFALKSIFKLKWETIRDKTWTQLIEQSSPGTVETNIF